MSENDEDMKCEYCDDDLEDGICWNDKCSGPYCDSCKNVDSEYYCEQCKRQ